MKRLKAGAVACALLLVPTAAQAEWFQVHTQHFTIYSDSSSADSLAFAKRLELFDESLRELQNLPPRAAIPDSAKVVVYRFGDTDAIGELAGSRGIAGFYIPRAAYPVAFTPARANRREGLRRGNDDTALDPMTVLQHEYTHHFMLRNFSASYPKWYVEGFAELNATIEQLDGGKFLVGKPANYRAGWLLQAPEFSVRKMLDPRFKYEDYETFAQLYATGWLLTHYLSFSSERSGQLSAYLKALGKGEDGLAAATRIFGDLGKLDADLRKYKASKLPAIVVTPANYKEPELTITPVDPDLARVMGQRIKAARGETRADAKAMLANLRDDAGSKNLDVQLLLAEVGLDARDYAFAASSADRALALNPRSVAAMVFKARTMIEAPGGDAKRYADARAILAKAHATDKTDARPLIEFYKAWRKQAVPVPEEAYLALEDAFPLAPQDEEFRLLLTRQLLEENRMEQAGQVIGPLAYSYDGRDPEKYTPIVVAAKIKDGDRTGALAAMNAEFAKREKEENKPT